jgi:hypothetical protein
VIPDASFIDDLGADSLDTVERQRCHEVPRGAQQSLRPFEASAKARERTVVAP